MHKSECKTHYSRICERFAPYKNAFFAACIIGILVHMYKFTNTLPNYDSLFNYYNHQNIVSSGRWFLMFACMPSSFFDLPWLIGVLSICYIALTAVLVTAIFKIKSTLGQIIIAGLLVTFPAVTETFFFEYTADGYMMAMLFAAVVVYLTQLEHKKWWFFVAGGTLLCLCCGIYQAYVSFAMVLTLCLLLMDLFFIRRTIRQYMTWIGKQLLMYVCALTAYFIIWKIMMRLWGVTAYDYQGISGVGHLDLGTIGWAVGSTLESFLSFFAGELLQLHRPSMYEILGVLFLIILAATLLVTAIKTNLLQNKVHFILSLLCVVLIPFAAHIWYFTSKQVEYDTRLLQSLCILFVLLIALLESLQLPKLRITAAALLLTTIFNFSIQANICYFYMQRCYETTYATAVEMLTRIHMVQNEESKYFVLIGDISDESGLGTGSGATTSREIRNLSGTLSKSLLFDYKLTYLFLWNDLGLTLGEIWDSAQQQDIAQMPEVQKMGTWPAADSVQAINDMVIIKLSELDNE